MVRTPKNDQNRWCNFGAVVIVMVQMIISVNTMTLGKTNVISEFSNEYENKEMKSSSSNSTDVRASIADKNQTIKTSVIEKYSEQFKQVN